MKNEKNTKWYLGLDIGTDSVGWAVTDNDYKILKYKNNAMWGVMLFDPANQSEERRSFRTSRRRLDRRQQRILKGYSEICIIDQSPTGLLEKKSVNLLEL